MRRAHGACVGEAEGVRGTQARGGGVDAGVQVVDRLLGHGAACAFDAQATPCVCG